MTAAVSFSQVFDVRLNGHVVVRDLDIFDRVGHSTAHDEIVPFSIRRGKLSVQGEVSTFNGKLTVEFVKVRLRLPGDGIFFRCTCPLRPIGRSSLRVCFRVTMTTPRSAPSTS